MEKESGAKVEGPKLMRVLQQNNWQKTTPPILCTWEDG